MFAQAGEAYVEALSTGAAGACASALFHSCSPMQPNPKAAITIAANCFTGRPPLRDLHGSDERRRHRPTAAKRRHTVHSLLATVGMAGDVIFLSWPEFVMNLDFGYSNGIFQSVSARASKQRSTFFPSIFVIPPVRMACCASSAKPFTQGDPARHRLVYKCVQCSLNPTFTPFPLPPLQA